MATHDTNRREVTRERLTEALNGLHDLQEWLVKTEDALQRAIQENNGDGISIFWASEAVAKLLVVYNEIARCNGAALVKVEKTS